VRREKALDSNGYNSRSFAASPFAPPCPQQHFQKRVNDARKIRDAHGQIAGRTNERFNTVRDAHSNLVSINSSDPGLLIGRKK
jgi:hypothetical protein